MSRLSFVLIFIALLSGCVSMPEAPLPDWQAPLHRSHPLVGSIWDVNAERYLSPHELLQDLSQVDYALLGEKHDNPDHHQLQAYVLRRLYEAAVLASVSFEMLDSSQKEALASIPLSVLQSSDALKSHLGWDEDGWNWGFYGPMLYELLHNDVKVRSANISSDEMMSIYGNEDSDAIKGVLSQEQLLRLEREIDESHCGMLPASQFAPMMRVQRSRDAQMAMSLQDGANARPGVSVLIAGNFHARRDLGVPNYLPEPSKLKSLSFIELREESSEPRDYVLALEPGQPYDYLWFTPAVASQDYCASLRGDD